MAKRYNARAVKKHHTYTVEEAAEALDAHIQTVRSWGDLGLRIMKSKTPHLILGDDLHRFLASQERGRKRPLGPNELYCLKCRGPKIPEGRLADFILTDSGKGRLSGICPDCGRMCHRFAQEARLADIAPDLEVHIPSHVESLEEQAPPASRTHRRKDHL